MRNILLIDTSALLHKAKHTLGSKLSYKDADTGILFGFLSQIGKLCNKYQTNRMVFALDSASSKRSRIYPEYKKNRSSEKSPAEKSFDNYCYERFDEVVDILENKLHFKNIWCADGYEADDIIATFLLQNPDKGKNSIIVSSDNDYYQLLHKCKGMHTSKDSLYTERLFTQEWDLHPKKWTTVKKIAGCSGDNVKSVPGVGYKTAANYLKGNASDSKIALIESKEMIPVIRMALRLTRLPFDGSIVLPDFEENDLCFDDMLEVCSIYGFNSIIADRDRYNMWERIFNGNFVSKKIQKDAQGKRKRTAF